MTLKRVLAGAVLGGVGFAVLWQWQHSGVATSPSVTSERAASTSAVAPAALVSRPSTRDAVSAQAHAADFQTQFRQSGNYGQFVRGVAAAAAAGEPAAEYLTAKALKYCSEYIRRNFRNSNGSIRTRDELEVRIGRFPPGFQQQILDAYERCGDFLAESDPLGSTASWEGWLAKAVAAGYPPAQSLQADIWREAALLRDAGRAPALEYTPPPPGPARDLALEAVLSGNPESILEMANWVDGSKHSQDVDGDLMGAWQLLACQRGDDCGPNSDWFRSVCSFDPQCANDRSVTDWLRRQFGSRFEEIETLAGAIGRAVDSGDQAAVEGYL